ncbi:MAG TPA: response regulator, partial [Nitrospira sp.]|nr:response regulator [Nitrospira sp.]
MDYHMPRLNGLQFIEMCRMMWPETPIILMSVDNYVTDRSDLAKEVFACIAKPFESSRLNEAPRSKLRGITELKHSELPEIVVRLPLPLHIPFDGLPVCPFPYR